MPILFGKAPGKIILFGEHAVVYGQPAIAIPVTKVYATARIVPKLDCDPGRIFIQAKDLAFEAELADLPGDHPLAAPIHLTIDQLSMNHLPAFTVEISSTIPIAAGMGSSAAVSVAIIRGLSSFFNSPLSPEAISEIAYKVEIIHHGTPSGIDNTVIAYEKPVYFRRNDPIECLDIEQPTSWVIADTGESTPTRETVANVSELLSHDPETYRSIFEDIGAVSKKARRALIDGDAPALGQLMDLNQGLLEKLSVSSQRLDILISAARSAGAFGAKLSGGGRGGNMIAAVPPELVPQTKTALLSAGAKRVITTVLPARNSQ